MKSNLISKSETAQILKSINSQWRIELPKQKNLMFHHIDNKTAIIIGKELTALKIGEDVLPFLDEMSILKKFPKKIPSKILSLNPAVNSQSLVLKYIYMSQISTIKKYRHVKSCD